MSGIADQSASVEPVSIAAPAKLNLGLRVLGRRSDGYHRIESLFVPLDLCDEVEIEWQRAPAPSVCFSIELADADLRPGDVPGGPDNLAARAARSFLDAAGLDLELRLRLRKRIPVAAGLGGGSSDAGAVLRAMSELFPSALPAGEARRLALELGADVCFFLDPRPALVSGVGEIVTPVDRVPPLAFLLANPGVSLSTVAVYQTYDGLPSALTPVKPGSTMRALSGLQGDPSALAGCFEKLLENDLEPAALRLCPALAGLRERIRAAGALGTGMSGSGATVFGAFSDQLSARSALENAAFEPPVWARVVGSLGS